MNPKVVNNHMKVLNEHILILIHVQLVVEWRRVFSLFKFNLYSQRNMAAKGLCLGVGYLEVNANQFMIRI